MPEGISADDADKKSAEEVLWDDCGPHVLPHSGRVLPQAYHAQKGQGELGAQGAGTVGQERICSDLASNFTKPQPAGLLADSAI